MEKNVNKKEVAQNTKRRALRIAFVLMNMCSLNKNLLSILFTAYVCNIELLSPYHQLM